MEKISICFNETGNFFRFALNYQGIKLLIAVSIPYLWYGNYNNPRKFEPAKQCWHFRYKNFVYIK